MPKVDRVEIIREGVSAKGYPVRLRRECASYPDARPYFVTEYNIRPTSVATTRYNPDLDRAEWLYEKFLQDVTDPDEIAPSVWARDTGRLEAWAAWAPEKPRSGTLSARR